MIEVVDPDDRVDVRRDADRLERRRLGSAAIGLVVIALLVSTMTTGRSRPPVVDPTVEHHEMSRLVWAAAPWSDGDQVGGADGRFWRRDLSGRTEISHDGRRWEPAPPSTAASIGWSRHDHLGSGSVTVESIRSDSIRLELHDRGQTSRSTVMLPTVELGRHSSTTSSMGPSARLDDRWVLTVTVRQRLDLASVASDLGTDGSFWRAELDGDVVELFRLDRPSLIVERSELDLPPDVAPEVVAGRATEVLVLESTDGSDWRVSARWEGSSPVIVPDGASLVVLGLDADGGLVAAAPAALDDWELAVRAVAGEVFLRRLVEGSDGDLLLSVSGPVPHLLRSADRGRSWVEDASLPLTATGVAEGGDGLLVVAGSSPFDGGFDPLVAWSRDSGGTWEIAEVVPDDPSIVGVPAAVALNDSTVVLALESIGPGAALTGELPLR